MLQTAALADNTIVVVTREAALDRIGHEGSSGSQTDQLTCLCGRSPWPSSPRTGHFGTPPAIDGKRPPKLPIVATELDAYAFATICRDLDCFTRADAACRVPICLPEAGRSQVLGLGAPSLRRGSPRPVLSPRGPAAPFARSGYDEPHQQNLEPRSRRGRKT